MRLEVRTDGRAHGISTVRCAQGPAFSRSVDRGELAELWLRLALKTPAALAAATALGVLEQFRELEHAAFMTDLGGGHQYARELAMLSGQIDLADVLVELDQLEVVAIISAL